MQPLEVINRGFGGGRIFEVNHYFDDLLVPHDPKGIVFYAGENDLSDFFWVKAPSTPEQVFEDFVKFHEHASDIFSGIPIFFISIKPPKSRIKNWEAMQKANKLIFDYCQEKDNLYYIDVVDPMTDENGNILDGISAWDGIHLNEKGYKIWTDTIKPILLQYYVA
jgi:lysophospholipase L1-like esterase